MTRKITCHPGDRRTRDTMREAHDLGRHGAPDAPLEILSYWAPICLDCHARWHYEVTIGA